MLRMGVLHARAASCTSRALVQKSLALVAYTENPDALIAAAIRNKWFFVGEIEQRAPPLILQFQFLSSLLGYQCVQADAACGCILSQWLPGRHW